MANTEMRFQGLLTTLTKPLGYSSPSSRQRGHMTTLFTSLFLLAINSRDVFWKFKVFRDYFIFY